ncbi:MAG: aminotransferase class I/II-fold pyridoxal phosphate-dependent enzyme [Chloroflexi bacterium]|nr:MAG: aminotransferase class I/II-fold pyridoxal phosphate-dependent enzyme [Chloroflexota bacterium]
MTTERQVSRKAARSPIVAAAAVTVDLSSNDYLGLRNDPRVRAAAIRAIERYGVGSGGARDVAVGMGLVHELEQRLALYKGVPIVRVTQSGYAANIGIIPVLVAGDDVVILDRQSHRSSADGATLSGARVLTYPHADMAALAEAVHFAADGKHRVLIVTDGVFGMSGDIAPLPRIVEIAEAAGAEVMVHLASACLAALDVIEAEPERNDLLWANRHRLADGLASAGIDIGPSQTPIVPVILRDPALALELGRRIRARGVIAGILVPPKVAPHEARLRLIASAAHSPAEIDFAVSVIADASRSIDGTADRSARV